MNTIKIKKNKTKMVAHRGLSGIEKENTNSAFVAAGNRSYFGIETDIHRTRDGKFVTIHDGGMERVCGERIAVEEVSLDVSRSVILPDVDGSQKRYDLRVSSLEEYLSICKKYEKKSILELKSSFTEDEIKRIIDIIKEANYLKNVIFISFEYDNLLKVKKLLPKQKMQYLVWSINDELVKKLACDGMDVNSFHEALNEENIKMLHENGLKVNCWTVNDKQRADELISWGIDFITTNILE